MHRHQPAVARTGCVAHARSARALLCQLQGLWHPCHVCTMHPAGLQAHTMAPLAWHPALGPGSWWLQQRAHSSLECTDANAHRTQAALCRRESVARGPFGAQSLHCGPGAQHCIANSSATRSQGGRVLRSLRTSRILPSMARSFLASASFSNRICVWARMDQDGSGWVGTGQDGAGWGRMGQDGPGQSQRARGPSTARPQG